MSYYFKACFPRHTFITLDYVSGDTGFLGSDISPYHSGNHMITDIITYQAYTAYSKEELHKNRIFTAKIGSLLYSGKI